MAAACFSFSTILCSGHSRKFIPYQIRHLLCAQAIRSMYNKISKLSFVILLNFFILESSVDSCRLLCAFLPVLCQYSNESTRSSRTYPLRFVHIQQGTLLEV